MSDPFDDWKTDEADPCPYCGRVGHPVGRCPDGLADAAERRDEVEREDPPDPRTWEYWERRC